MVAIDCDVLAHLLLDGAETPRARALLGRDADWHSEGFILVELTNALANAMRVRKLSMSDASGVLLQASVIVDGGLHAADAAEVLALAAHYRVSTYDARYLVVARDLRVLLITEDARLRAAAPRLTQSLADAVGY